MYYVGSELPDTEVQWIRDGEDQPACDNGRMDLVPISDTEEYDRGKQEDKIFLLGMTAETYIWA